MDDIVDDLKAFFNTFLVGIRLDENILFLK